MVSGRSDFGVYNSELVLARLRGKRVMASQRELTSAPFAAMFRYFNVSQRDLDVVPHSYDIQPFVVGKVDAMTAFLSNEAVRAAGIRCPVQRDKPCQRRRQRLGCQSVHLRADGATAAGLGGGLHPGHVARLQRCAGASGGDRRPNPHRNKYSQHKSREALLFEAQTVRRLMLPRVYPIGSIDQHKIESLADLYIELGMAGSKAWLQGFVCAGPVVDLSPAEQAFVDAHPVLRVGKPSWQPMDFDDQGVPHGFAVDPLGLVTCRIGMRTEPASSPIT